MEKDLLLKAADKYGTPLYVYDADIIRGNVQKLKNAFTESTEIHYAIKALDNIEILKLIRAEGCGVDAVSQQELMLALKAGFEPTDINFTPSGAPLEEYIWAYEQGIIVHVDNVATLARLGKVKRGFPVSLRFNPLVRSGGFRKIQVGAEDSKFGLFPEEMESAHKTIADYGIEVRRIHVHVGSDIKTPEDFMLCWKQAFSLAERYRNTVSIIDLGGGFGVKYFDNDDELNLGELGQRINTLREKYESDTGIKIKLMIEPGKSITGTAGYFLVKATATKRVQGQNLVYVDSGFNHLLRPMYYGAKHRIENLSGQNAKEQYKVVGYLCETDTFSESVLLNGVEIGDVLCFFSAGAYCFTMSSNYNARLRPPEVLLEQDELRLIRRREEFDDLLKTQVSF